MQISGWRSYDLKGKFLKHGDARIAENKQLHEKYGKETTLLGWHEIRQLLFEYLPSGIVEFDKQVPLLTTMQLNDSHLHHNTMIA